jgi:hypothetical protein
MKALVAGALANKPWNGGAAWTRLSWALGLKRLGLEVRFVEQARTGHDFFAQVTHDFGLDATLLDNDDVPEELDDWARDAALLVNISGHLAVEPLRSLPRRRVYVDLDPGYTQLWGYGARVAGHDAYYSVGENVVGWRPIRQPVLLDEWPVVNGVRDRFTTVASWRGAYGRIGHYSQKAHEFRKVIALPRRTRGDFELALEIHPGDARDLHALRDNGWSVVAAARDPAEFRAYVQNSAAEFSPAQGIYVEKRSGWFSDRSARYLASGKPALVQDTGTSLPTGAGLLTWRTLDDAAEGAERILADYEGHARAARALAEEHFDSDRVLGRLLEEVL